MDEKKTRIRLKDVAAQAGVSAMAVSAALNGRGRISAERAESIRKIAVKMGYRTNAAAQILKRKKGGDMGLVILETAELIRPNTSLAEMTITFSESCRKLNVRPQIEWFDYRLNPRQLPDMFFNGLVDGLLVYGYGTGEINDTLNNGVGIPIVRLMEPGDFSVYLDIRREIADLVDYLHLNGHRRIMMLNGNAETGFHVFKTAKESFFAGAKRLGLASADVFYREMKRYDLEELREFTSEIVARKPTAVVMHNASRAKALICELILRGMMVPRDVSVVCFGTQDFDCDFNIPITATNSDIGEVTRQAVKLLRARMENDALPNTSIAIRPLLTERDSVRNLNL